MKKQTLLSLAASLSLVGAQILPAAAQSAIGGSQPQSGQSVVVPTTSPADQGPMQSRAAAAPRNISIPTTTGIIVSFLAPVAIDADEDPYPLTVPLAQAITDANGNVIIPENSPVSILIQPEDDGARIVAQSVVVNGQIVPIQASSPVIPGTTITHMRANDRAMENGAVWGRMLGSGMGFLSGGNPDEFDRGAMLGSVIGMVTGRRSDKTRVVQIPQGSVYVLTLQEEILIGL